MASFLKKPGKEGKRQTGSSETVFLALATEVEWSEGTLARCCGKMMHLFTEPIHEFMFNKK